LPLPVISPAKAEVTLTAATVIAQASTMSNFRIPYLPVNAFVRVETNMFETRGQRWAVNVGHVLRRPRAFG
jgi:hypothetical protein